MLTDAPDFAENDAQNVHSFSWAICARGLTKGMGVYI